MINIKTKIFDILKNNYRTTHTTHREAIDMLGDEINDIIERYEQIVRLGDNRIKR